MMLIAFLLFPGLLFVVLLALALRFMLENTRPGLPKPPPFCFEAACAGASLLLAAAASALLPWPFHPAGNTTWLDSPFGTWLALEGACLVALLPGLLSSDPLVNRAGIREAQMGLAGRAIFWVAVGGLLWAGQPWSMTSLPGKLLLLAGGALALPVAMGVGPFAQERTLALSGTEQGLQPATAAFQAFARAARSAVLLAALALTCTPLGRASAAVVILLWLAVTALALVLLRRIATSLPRGTLPAALRWCWWRALPLAALGTLYLAVVRG